MKKLMKLFSIMLVMCLMFCATSTLTYATEPIDAGGTAEEVEGDSTVLESTLVDDKSKTSNFITYLFTKDLYNNNRALSTGRGLAQPVVYILYIIIVFVFVVVAYAFCAVTTLDLAYIFIPPLRPLLLKSKKKKEGFGGDGGNGGKLAVISDACLEVCGQGGGNKMGGSGDSATSGRILSYAKIRSKEFAVFICFALLILTGMLGRLVMIVFNLCASALQAILNLVNI